MSITNNEFCVASGVANVVVELLVNVLVEVLVNLVVELLVIVVVEVLLTVVLVSTVELSDPTMNW
jgi:hypothetical protein